MATATALPLITDARRARWAEMVRDRNPLMARVFQAADGPPGAVYGDHGQWTALAYQITGNPAYHAKSWARVRGYLGKNPGDPNQVKEIGWEFPCMVAMLRDRLSAAEIEEAYTGLARWCSWVGTYNPWLPNKGWRYGDSDQTTGQYMMFRLTDLVTGGTSFAQLPQAIGGRDAIRGYVAKAEGGLWIESPDYNADTLPILFLGYEAINSLSGVDEFPEVTALLPQLADWAEFDFSEDLRWTPPWSDTQERGNPWWFHLYPCLTILAGLTNHPKVKRIVERAQATVSDSDKWSGWSKCLYIPEGIPPFAKPQADKSWRFAPKMGIIRFDTPTTLFHAHINPKIGVDHEVSYNRDLSLWADGEVVIGRPAGYAGATVDNTGTNSILLAGLSRAPSGPRTVKESGGADWCGMVGTIAGPYFPLSYWEPPPDFLRASPTATPEPMVSSIAFIDGLTRVVVTRDRIRITDPRQISRYTRYAQIEANAGKQIEASPALVQLNIHSPVKPTVTGNRLDWRTAKNSVPVSVRFLATDPSIFKGVTVIDELVLWPSGTATPGMSDDQKHWQSRVLCDGNDLTIYSVWCVGPDVPAVLNADGSVKVGSRVVSFAADGTPQVN